ncbi:MAG: S8 family peptidase, partial [Halothiobacillaceae bacterium]
MRVKQLFPLALLIVMTMPGGPAVADALPDAGSQSMLEALHAEARQAGTVDVLVKIDPGVQLVPEGRLDTMRKRSQRAQVSRTQERLLEALGRSGQSEGVRRFDSISFLWLTVTPDELDRLASLPGVIAIRPDRKLKPRLLQSVPQVGADHLFAEGFDASGWAVAVIDDGVHVAHPFLGGRVTHQACFAAEADYCRSATQATPRPLNEAEWLEDDLNHGTHVAGIAAGAHPEVAEFSGVARGADIVAVAVDLSDSAIFEAVEYVMDLHDSGQARVAAINMSFGDDFYFEEPCDDAPIVTGYPELLAQLRSRGIAVVAASGNERDEYGLQVSGGDPQTGVISPACLTDAIAVGAVTKQDRIASYSNHNDLIDLLAPGGAGQTAISEEDLILSSVYDHEEARYGYEAYEGTSMATPHVAGAFALLRQVAPEATVDELLAAMVETGVVINRDEIGMALVPKP